MPLVRSHPVSRAAASAGSEGSCGPATTLQAVSPRSAQLMATCELIERLARILSYAGRFLPSGQPPVSRQRRTASHRYSVELAHLCTAICTLRRVEESASYLAHSDQSRTRRKPQGALVESSRGQSLQRLRDACASAVVVLGSTTCTSRQLCAFCGSVTHRQEPFWRGRAGAVATHRQSDATSVLSAKWNLVYMRCRYIVDYAKAKGRALDVTSWRQEGPRDCDCPQQSNEVDCGAFVCMFAVHAAHDMPLAFSQDDMPAVRRHIVCSILLGDGC